MAITSLAREYCVSQRASESSTILIADFLLIMHMSKVISAQSAFGMASELANRRDTRIKRLSLKAKENNEYETCFSPCLGKRAAATKARKKKKPTTHIGESASFVTSLPTGPLSSTSADMPSVSAKLSTPLRNKCGKKDAKNVEHGTAQMQTRPHKNAYGLRAPHHELGETPHVHEETFVPKFTRQVFRIYEWPYGDVPCDFTELSKSQKEFKNRTDSRGTDLEADDGSDDWAGFAGDRSLYEGSQYSLRGFELEYAVARNFVTHAKRAHRKGKSWAEFEAEEEDVDACAVAKSISDPVVRYAMVEQALSNDLRRAVFAALKERLCNEIWSQAYVPRKTFSDKRDCQFSTAQPQKRLHMECYVNDSGRTTKGWIIIQNQVVPVWK